MRTILREDPRHFLRLVIYFVWNRLPKRVKFLLRTSYFGKKLSALVLTKVSFRVNYLANSFQEKKLPNVVSIDVVITSYNQSPFLAETIRSILSQKASVNQIIVINHCENSKEIQLVNDVIHSFHSPNLQIHHIPECWPGTARNYGATKVTSDTILFVDADDLVDKDYVANCIFYMNFLDLDFVGSWCQTFTIDSDSQDFGEIWRIPKLPNLSNLITSNAFPVSSLMRSSMFSKLQGWRDFDSENNRQDEAIDIWRRALLTGYRGMNIQQPMIFLRRHLNNLSSTRSEQTLFESARMKNSWERLLKEEKISRPANVEEDLDYFPDAFETYANTFGIDSKTVIFLLPDKTFYGAGKVIKWMYELISKEAKIILINCDIQNLGGQIEFNDLLGLPILELGSVIHPSDWGYFLYDLIEKTGSSAIYTFGHPLVNEVITHLKEKCKDREFYGFLFNTQSMNAIWLGNNPNVFSKIMVESKNSLTWLLKHGWAEQKILKINHNAHRYGVNLNLPRNDTSESRLKILWFGRFSSEKQPEKFVQLSRLCAPNSNLNFLMGGIGPDKKNIRRVANKLANIEILEDHISNFEAFSNASIYVSTSSQVEGRPLTVIEALEMGLIVFAPNVGSISEFVQDGYIGIIIYEDLKELVLELENLSTLEINRDMTERAIKNREISDSRLERFNLN